MVELRKEIVGSQRIRAQVIGFKITLVSAGIGLIVGNIQGIPKQLLVVPAFAAIFFDLLINSYSISIKRIGFYCRNYIEPILRADSGWPVTSPLWEEFMSQRENRQSLSLIGNLGITSLAVATAIFTLFNPFRLFLSIPAFLGLMLFLYYDLITFLQPRRIIESGLRSLKGK